jgi:flavin-binding protein dodecin
MSVAKVIELSAESPEGFEAAVREGIARASKTLKNVKAAWIKHQQVVVENGKVTSYRVDMKVTFVMED